MFAQVEQRLSIKRGKGKQYSRVLVRPLIVFLSQLDYDEIRKF